MPGFLTFKDISDIHTIIGGPVLVSLFSDGVPIDFSNIFQ